MATQLTFNANALLELLAIRDVLGILEGEGVPRRYEFPDAAQQAALAIYDGLVARMLVKMRQALATQGVYLHG